MAPPGRRRALRAGLIRSGQLGLTVLVTWLIVRRVGVGFEDLRNLDASTWSPDLLLLTASSVLLLTSYFVSAAIWGRIVTDLGGPRIPAHQAVRLFMIANLGRYIPGKVWQIAGLAALAKGRGVPAVTATGAAILGQGIALVAASAIGVLALLTSPAPFDRFGLGVAAVIAAGTLVAAIPGVFTGLAGAWFKIAKTEAPEGLGAVHGLRWLWLYALNWGMYALSFWILTLSFGLEGALVPVASAFAAAYVIGYAMVFAPAGLGPREGFLIAFLTPHFGIAPSSVIAIVARIWTTAVEVVPAGVFWFGHLAAAKDGSEVTRSGASVDE